MFGDITVKSRPLRLAFLITPEKSVLRKAIQINSTLWGGPFNPIIPLYSHTPKAWKEYPHEKGSVRDRVLGYMRAFDPDILVNCTTTDLPTYLSNFGRPIISIDEIWSDFFSDKQDGTAKYGIGIFELLNGMYKEFFEVKRRFPIKVSFPIIPKEHQLFWAAAVGELPSAIQDVIETSYGEAIDIEKPEISAQNYESILHEHIFFPRRIARYGLKTENSRNWHDHAYGYYMDADNFLEIVDFWNLRALGRAVMPIPKQFVDIPEFLALVRTFVRANYGVNRHNPAITYGTHIVRSSSSTMGDLEHLAKALEVSTLIPNNPNARALSLQHWYPRIWNEWAIGKDGATPDNVSANVEEFSFPDTDGNVTLNVVKPDFIADGFGEHPRYANEIYPKFYSQRDTILADVLPYDHGQEVLRVAGGSVSLRDEFRIGRTGLVRLIAWKHKARWKIPLAEEVFLAWLKDKGFTAELSSCGRLARELHAQLGGWLHALTNEPFLTLLEKMNRGGEDGKGAPLGAVKNELKKIGSGGNFYQSLVQRGVFQLGYRTQCTHCQRLSWHSLDDLAAQLVCPLCHKKFDAIAAVDSDNQGAWHLKTAGPFSVGNYGEGSYCVLLAFNFFERDHSLQTTPVMSFTAKHDVSGETLEADLGLFWQDTVFGELQDGVIFAECKSYNKFQRKDFDRMKQLAKQFPGAILAFCTLRPSLEPGEVRELRRITKMGMKYWKNDRPLNPVLILTGRELFNFVGAPYCWNGMDIPEWAKRGIPFSTYAMLHNPYTSVSRIGRKRGEQNLKSGGGNRVLKLLRHKLPHLLDHEVSEVGRGLLERQAR
jgi:hypothetical protein